MTAGMGLVAQWAKYYGDHKALSAGITAAHLAGVLLGGGMAVASDRTSLSLQPDEPGLTRALERLADVHKWVLVGLTVTFASGLLMLFSDLGTFLGSALYWTKMGLVAVLLANGYVRMRAERTLGRDPKIGWGPFRTTSAVSLVLWFAILVCGVFLTTVS
jgi:hypothetical protein